MPPGPSGRDSDKKILNGPPSSGPISTPLSSSGRPPADVVAWGAVRDAITSIHNLEALLKSPRVGTKVLADVLHEFLNGVEVLRAAFAKAATTAETDRVREARIPLAEHTRARLDELERAMRSVVTGDFDARGRLGLEHVVVRVSVELDAAAELLDLSERAEHPAPTEVSLAQLARVSVRAAREGEVDVPLRVAGPVEDCVLRVDPHVFRRLVAFAVARVYAQGAMQIVLRVYSDPECATVEVGPMRAVEESLPVTRGRLVRRIDPTDAIVAAAAETAGVEVVATGAVVTLSVRRPVG